MQSTLSTEADDELIAVVDLCLSAEYLENFVPYPNAELIGERKPEAETQTEREASVLAVTYFDESEVPACPTEPAEVVAQMPLPDTQIPRMPLSWDLQKDDFIQMQIAAAQTRPFEQANNWHTQPEPAAANAPPFQQQQQQQQAAVQVPNLGGDDLTALLAKLSQGGLQIPPAQPPMHYSQCV